ncbi:hypothetical protein ADL12_46720 [Streptomyces regalis]|uniref:Uncharacterized protein n=1 Tax=Streptomyces regalis TaxID=68262 RepID=A0A117MJM3_9ACTN|nr:hypothetical protein ADL12_46720 [Streptomyces regalis]
MADIGRFGCTKVGSVRPAGQRIGPVLTVSEDPHAAQVLGSLVVEDVGNVAVGPQHAESVDCRYSSGRSQPPLHVGDPMPAIPASVMAYRLRSGPLPASIPSTSTRPFFSGRDIVEQTWA